MQPAAQNKAESEAIFNAGKEKPAVSEPLATDDVSVIEERSATACGAVGTNEEFIENRRKGLEK